MNKVKIELIKRDTSIPLTKKPVNRLPLTVAGIILPKAIITMTNNKGEGPFVSSQGNY
jgi:hypothetical protein